MRLRIDATGVYLNDEPVPISALHLDVQAGPAGVLTGHAQLVIAVDKLDVDVDTRVRLVYDERSPKHIPGDDRAELERRGARLHTTPEGS